MANEKEAKNNKRFFKDFKAELKKVVWPTPKQVVKNTIAVITIVLITAVLVFILDLVFDAINEYGINRLKSSVRNKVVVENTVDTTNETENTTEVVNTQVEATENATESSENVQ